MPILFGALMDLNGVRSSAFMPMCGVVRVSLAWRHRTGVRGTELMAGKASAVLRND